MKQFIKGDLTILIGENAIENDYLVKTAIEEDRYNDYWIHVSNYSSAHCLILNPNNKRISQKILKFCCVQLKINNNKCKSVKNLEFDISKIKHIKTTNVPGCVNVEKIIKNVKI
jgi:predicted ribosome quality control (RQC) complex YloA/Tae2 family protein